MVVAGMNICVLEHSSTALVKRTVNLKPAKTLRELLSNLEELRRVEIVLNVTPKDGLYTIYTSETGMKNGSLNVNL